MEPVHGSDKRGWISEKNSLKNIKNMWHSLLSAYYAFEAVSDVLTQEDYASFENSCSVQVCPKVSTYEFKRSFDIPPNTNFKTLLKKKEDLEKRNKNIKYDHVVYHNFKSYNYPPIKIMGWKTKTKLRPIPIEEPEVILNVQIYRPQKRNSAYVKIPFSKAPTFKIEQEFMVLGCQFLHELRDKIECASDKTVCCELSDFPEMDANLTSKDIYKSGFFYINGVFYNDMRDLNCRDYSDNIVKWSESVQHGVQKMHKGFMEKTKFIDLTLCLGYPYVYVHQGNCEHILVFSDLRLMSTFDVKDRNAYPIFVSNRPRKRAPCITCQAYTAQWVVYGNKRLPENPSLFCKQCFFDFNYDDKNQKIGDFKAYHFVDRTTFDN